MDDEVTSSPSGDEPTADVSHVAGADGQADTALPALDLDDVANELDAVDAALTRLADGTYWTDEVTGQPLPDSVLSADPLARRA